MPSFFFFNDTATTEIYTLSLHDALPISPGDRGIFQEALLSRDITVRFGAIEALLNWGRSEEHTSELQSQSNLVCRLLLEKKKKDIFMYHTFLMRVYVHGVHGSVRADKRQ